MPLLQEYVNLYNIIFPKIKNGACSFGVVHCHSDYKREVLEHWNIPLGEKAKERERVYFLFQRMCIVTPPSLLPQIREIASSKWHYFEINRPRAVVLCNCFHGDAVWILWGKRFLFKHRLFHCWKWQTERIRHQKSDKYLIYMDLPIHAPL